MPAYVCVSGIYRNALIYVCVGGIYKRVRRAFVCVNGIYKAINFGSWATGSWATCTGTCCASTNQSRTVQCKVGSTVVNDTYCSAHTTKPATSQSCTVTCYNSSNDCAAALKTASGSITIGSSNNGTTGKYTIKLYGGGGTGGTGGTSKRYYVVNCNCDSEGNCNCSTTNKVAGGGGGGGGGSGGVVTVTATIASGAVITYTINGAGKTTTLSKPSSITLLREMISVNRSNPISKN